jgi:hypothetical protein
MCAIIALCNQLVKAVGRTLLSAAWHRKAQRPQSPRANASALNVKDGAYVSAHGKPVLIR